MSVLAVQLAFDFGEDWKPEEKPENQILPAEEKVKSELIPVTSSKKGKSKFYKKATQLGQYDPAKTVVLDQGADGLLLRPMSREAAAKLELFCLNNLGLNEQPLENFKYQTLINLETCPDDQDLFLKMNISGLQVVMTKDAWCYMDQRKRRMRRFFIPFRFQVPKEFQEIQGEVAEDCVPGPFVDQVYKSEMIRARRQLERLGLMDPSKPFHLHEFQADDVAQLAVKKFAYLGHEQGLGKTCMAVALGLCVTKGNILVVAPAAAIGSFSSGWRHEIHRCGVPKENIHLLEKPEDLPDPNKSYEANEYPHFFLVDYTTLSKEKIKFASYTCPTCGDTVSEKDQGCCSSIKHQRFLEEDVQWGNSGSKENPLYIPGSNTLHICPHCVIKSKNAGTFEEDEPMLEKAWGGNYCDPHKGGCGWRLITRELTKGRQKKGYTETKPIWKCMHPGMFDVMFIDESQMIRNISSRRSKAVQMIKGCKRIYIMTGTMVTNYVQDVFWQLLRLCPGGMFPVESQFEDFLSYSARNSKKQHGSKMGVTKFLKEFQGSRISSRGTCQVHTISHPKTFWKMLACFMVRRRSEDEEVAREVTLPPTEFHTEFIEMDPAHQAIYDLYAGNFKKALGPIQPGNIQQLNSFQPLDLKTRLSNLRQICVCPDQELAYQGSTTTKDARMLEIVQEQISKDRKTVVFCTFTDHLNRLETLFKQQNIPTVVVTGQTRRGDKWEIIDKWRSTKEAMVMLTTIGCMGQAVNLIPAEGVTDFKVDTVIFGSPDWVPATMYQAWRRVNRIGQTEPVKVYFLYHKGTIEEDMDELLEAKLALIAKAIDRCDHTREGSVAELSAQDIALRVLDRLQGVFETKQEVID